MGKKNITKKQHYVPQTYLRGFSEDNKRFWSYSLDPIDNGTFVPIESVCRENYLYEIRGEDGNILVPNMIEKMLSRLEGMFATNLQALEKKAFFEENYQTKCFLTQQEKVFWRTYVGVQMMRSPTVLQITKDVANEYLGNQLSNNLIESFAISQCLPFFNELKTDDKNVFVFFLKPLLNMSMAIGVDEAGTLFTSDEPVYCHSPRMEDFTQIEEYEKIIMPLTSKLVLILIGGKLAKEYDKNRLFLLDHEDQEDIKLSIAYTANQRVFSKDKLSIKDILIIQKARKDKKEDIVIQRG